MTYFKTTLFLAALALSFVGHEASATVTLQFSQSGVARATGFANSSGVPTDGMRWGLIVSTSNGSFNGGGYDVFDYNTSGFLSIGGVLTDDYYVAHPSMAVTSTLTATGTDPGGAGGINSITDVPYGGATGITANDSFSLVWFPTAPTTGSSYGMFTDPAFLIPPDGSPLSYAPVFAGSTADPAKPANLQFGVIPEPTRFTLLGLGAIGLFLRRRRM